METRQAAPGMSMCSLHWRPVFASPCECLHDSRKRPGVTDRGKRSSLKLWRAWGKINFSGHGQEVHWAVVVGVPLSLVGAPKGVLPVG